MAPPPPPPPEDEPAPQRPPPPVEEVVDEMDAEAPLQESNPIGVSNHGKRIRKSSHYLCVCVCVSPSVVCCSSTAPRG